MATTIFNVLAISVILFLSLCHGLGHIEERKRERRSDDLGPLETVVTQLSQEVTSLRAQLEAERNNKGSTFIRWGSSTCPATSDIVYTGVAGGSWFGGDGGNANRLCLSLQPEFDSVNHHSDVYSKIFGAEYDQVADKNNYEVPCAVCKAAQPSTVMVPGTMTCPPGWTVQYWGHLAGNYFRNQGAGEYVCLDNSPEAVGSTSDANGAVFSYTIAKCGSLPCPPYVADKVVSCVVCSQ